MSRLRRAAAVLLAVLFGATAHAGDPSRSLDSVDTTESTSLDAVDVGETETLDDLEAESESLDDAEAPPAAQSPPQPDDTIAVAQAREAVAVAQRRVTQANAAYSDMMARDEPTGDARAAIVLERDAARRGYEQANAAYTAMLSQ